MQTECVSVFFFVLIVALALAETRRHFVTAFTLGAVLAFAVLVRPGFVVVAPFVVLALALRPGLRLPSRSAIIALALAGFVATAFPWFSFNRARGVEGFSSGGGSALWVSLVQQDLLERDYPLPPDVARRYAPVAAKVGASNEMWTFVSTPADTNDLRNRMPKITRDWAIYSIQKNPLGYVKRLPYSFLWQMNYFPADGFIKETQITWFSYMVSCDNTDFGGRAGSNLRYSGIEKNVDLTPLSMSAEGGWMRKFFRWWGLNHPRGIPQLPLCALAVLAGALAIYRRTEIGRAHV